MGRLRGQAVDRPTGYPISGPPVGLAGHAPGGSILVPDGRAARRSGAPPVGRADRRPTTRRRGRRHDRRPDRLSCASTGGAAGSALDGSVAQHVDTSVGRSVERSRSRLAGDSPRRTRGRAPGPRPVSPVRPYACSPRGGSTAASSDRFAATPDPRTDERSLPQVLGPPLRRTRARCRRRTCPRWCARRHGRCLARASRRSRGRAPGRSDVRTGVRTRALPSHPTYARPRQHHPHYRRWRTIGLACGQSTSISGPVAATRSVGRSVAHVGVLPLALALGRARPRPSALAAVRTASSRRS